MCADVAVSNDQAVEEPVVVTPSTPVVPAEPSPLTDNTVNPDASFRVEGLAGVGTGNEDIFANPEEQVTVTNDVAHAPDQGDEPEVAPANEPAAEAASPAADSLVEADTESPDLVEQASTLWTSATQAIGGLFSSGPEEANETATAAPDTGTDNEAESPSLIDSAFALWDTTRDAISDVISPDEGDDRSLTERIGDGISAIGGSTSELIEDGVRSFGDTATEWIGGFFGWGEDTIDSMQDWWHDICDDAFDFLDDWFDPEPAPTVVPRESFSGDPFEFGSADSESDFDTHSQYPEGHRDTTGDVLEYYEPTAERNRRRRDGTFLGEHQEEHAFTVVENVEDDRESEEHVERAEDRRRAIAEAAEARLPDDHEAAVHLEQFVDDADIDYHQFGESTDSLAAKIHSDDPETEESLV